MLLYLKRAGNTMERSLIFRGYPLQDIMPRRAENNICAGVMELADVTDSKTNDLFGSSPLKNLDFTGFFSYH